MITKFLTTTSLALLVSLYMQASAAELDAFDMKKCVNMGNSLEAPRHSPWGAPIDTKHFALIKSKGFDTVRIPVRWSDYTADGPEFRIETDFTSKVKYIVDAALAQNLNVILNVHHFEEIMETPKTQIPKLVKLWEQISKTFASYSDDLWFEVLNEPHTNLKGQLLLQAQFKSVRAIRKENPTRIVILGGEEWSGIRTLETNMMPPDQNIVYTFHYYDPFDFTHQNAPWVGESMSTKKRGWGSEQDHIELEAAIKTAQEFEKAIERPLFVGEFGAYEKVKNKERVKYVDGVRKAMEEADIPWCLWSFSNTFPLYEAEKQKWDKAMLKALIPNSH